MINVTVTLVCLPASLFVLYQPTPVSAADIQPHLRWRIGERRRQRGRPKGRTRLLACRSADTSSVPPLPSSGPKPLLGEGKPAEALSAVKAYYDAAAS